VTTTFDGTPARIDHYAVYQSSTPFTRAAIRDGSTPPGPPLLTTTSASVEIDPGSGNRYYSVIVVDARGNVSPF